MVAVLQALVRRRNRNLQGLKVKGQGPQAAVTPSNVCEVLLTATQTELLMDWIGGAGGGEG